MKNQKGITLIALVITIIVLLILAGISIAMLTGDNGILSKASSAGSKTKLGEAEEALKLTVADIISDNLGTPKAGYKAENFKSGTSSSKINEINTNLYFDATDSEDGGYVTVTVSERTAEDTAGDKITTLYVNSKTGAVTTTAPSPASP